MIQMIEYLSGTNLLVLQNLILNINFKLIQFYIP